MPANGIGGLEVKLHLNNFDETVVGQDRTYVPEKFLEGKGSEILFEENVSKDNSHILDRDQCRGRSS